MNPKVPIPPQEEGAKSDTDHSVTCETEKQASDLFNLAAGRILNVNQWHLFAGQLSADFKLTDKSGKEVDRLTTIGDFFKIEIPGPGSSTGEGYDWVKIESIDDLRDPTENIEEISFRVRPAPSPLNKTDDTAHFFSDHATSTFSLTRNGKIVTAAVHGRNEVPNIHTQQAADNIRNAVVATGAVTLFAKIQWKSLVKGLLE